MPDRLIVVGQREPGEEYLAQPVDASLRGHGREMLPVSRLLRMLRYPDQKAIIWPEVLCEFDPLPGGALVRLPVLRIADEGDLSALVRFADYGASVRAAALDAQRRAPTEAQRMAIALQMAGRRKRVRSVYILTRLEAMEIETDSGGRVQAGDAAAQGLAPGGGALSGGEGGAGLP